jgi:ATP-dependent DNA helicase MPH1
MPLSTNSESDELFDFFDPLNFTIQDLQELDAAVDNDYRHNDYRRKEAAACASKPSSNTFGRSLSGRQTISDVLSPRSSSPKILSPSRGAQQRSPEHSADRKVKEWKCNAFAKTGTKWKTGKRKAIESDEYADEEDAVEFEQFPAPFDGGKLVI